MTPLLDRIRRFTDHPVTRISTGLILVVSSIAEGYDTFFDDRSHFRLRAHHGLCVFGLANIPTSLPDLIEGLESTTGCLAARNGGGEESPIHDAPADRLPG